MKVLHEVITTKAYEQALTRSEMNHRTEKPAVLFYGKGRKDHVVYSENGKLCNSKCSFLSNEVIPFDLDLRDDLKYFKNSRRTFINHMDAETNAPLNYSVKVCEVDLDGNYIRELDESEVLNLGI